ncbi:hypothetical protein PRIPAC_91985, partial [Pristionchus pacificus]
LKAQDGRKMPRRRIKKEPQTRPTQCIVCGAAAAGYNYGGASCARCKTFFRRAIIEKRVYNGCLRNGACDRDETVKLCRSCRYDRCLRGGMNPLLVAGVDVAEYSGAGSDYSGSDKPSTSRLKAVPRRKKMLLCKNEVECEADCSECIKRGCRHCCASTSQDSEDVPSDPGASQRDEELLDDQLRIMRNPISVECTLEKIMQNLLTLEEAHQKLRISKYTPKLRPGLSIDDFAPGPSKLGYEFGDDLQPMHSQPYELIAYKLVPIELLIRKRVFVDLTDFDYEMKKLWMFQDKVYALEYIKALPIYNQLDDPSKKVLLASALVCTNLTASFYSYTHHSDRVAYPDGSVMTWDSKIHKQSPGSTRLYTGIISAIREAELDTREYTLLKSIIICNPLLEGLHPYDIKLLQDEKERCAKALLSYVLTRRGTEEGPACYAKILSIVDVVTRLTNWQKSQCLLLFSLDLFKNRTPFAERMYLSL